MCASVCVCVCLCVYVCVSACVSTCNCNCVWICANVSVSVLMWCVWVWGGDVYSKFLCKLVPKSVPFAKKKEKENI